MKHYIKFTSISAGLLALIFLINVARIKTLGTNPLLTIGAVAIVFFVWFVSYVGLCYATEVRRMLR